MSWEAEVKELGEVCSFQRGLTYAKGDEVDLSENVVLRANNISMATNALDFAELKYLKDSITIPQNKLVRRDTLMICTASGSKSHLGKVAYVDIDYGYAFGGFMGLLAPEREVHGRYLYYAMLTDEYKEFIDGLSDGVNINNLKWDQLKTFTLPIPPLPEQQRIVGKLDAAFAALAEAQAHVERNRANARELFESYLNGVFEGKDWPMKKLKDVSLDFGRGKSKHRPRNDKRLYGGKYPFVQTGDVRNSEHFITEYTQTYNDFGLDQSKLWPKGTLCITIAANIAETAILGFESCFPDSVIGMVADPKQCDIHYVEYLLQSFKTILQAKGKGAAQDNLNLATFEGQLFPIPSVAEQQKIAADFNALTDKTRELETTYQQKLSELEGLKKGLLGAAFRGEL